MSLVIRRDEAESVLRSVGDPPNGIVGIASPEGEASWVIDTGWEPPTIDTSGPPKTLIVARPSETGMAPTAIPVDLEDLIAGLAGGIEAFVLMQMLGAAIVMSAQTFGAMLAFELIREHIDLAIRTRDALVDAGYIEDTR